MSYMDIGKLIGGVVGVVTFFACWIWAMGAWGFLLGFGLGWIPSAFVALIFGALTVPLWGLGAALLGILLLSVFLQ